MGKYEDFVNSHRSAFLRNYSYQYSTIIVGAAIALMGVGRLIAHQINTDYVPDQTLVVIEITTGVVGVILSVLLNATVASRIKRFNAVENES